jgi:hypothetical protein
MGVVLGMIAAALAAGAMQTLLFDIKGIDPLTFAAAPALSGNRRDPGELHPGSQGGAHFATGSAGTLVLTRIHILTRCFRRLYDRRSPRRFPRYGFGRAPVLSWAPPHNLTCGSSNRRVVSLRAIRLLAINETRAMVSSLSRYAVASVVVAGLAVSSLHGQAQSDQPRSTFRSAVDLVQHPGVGSRQARRPLPGLKASDFEVRDNGQPRSILSLRSDLRSPISVAVLVDMSGSMRVGAKNRGGAAGLRFHPRAAARWRRRNRGLHIRHPASRASVLHHRDRSSAKLSR